MSKVLVTGAAGFIGSNLVDHLLVEGYDVVGLDNFSTGKKENLQQAYTHSNFSFIEGDICDLDICKKVVEGCDFVLHQAALGSVPRSIQDPIKSNSVNVSGFLNMLVACKDSSVKKMIYAASSSTYGDSQDLPKVEEFIGRPLSPYAITKYVNELYADVFFKTYGFRTIGLRYFNVFGRKQDPNGAYAAVIPKFTSDLMSKRSPIINGDGSYSRDFTYIDNVVQANMKAMLTKNDEADNQVYNVAYGERTTLNQLIDLLKNELALFDKEIGNVDVVHGPLRIGDVPHSLASIEKAKRYLGYSPTHGMKEGLKEAVKWYWQNL